MEDEKMELAPMRNWKTRRAFLDYVAFGEDMDKLRIFYADMPNPPADGIVALRKMAKIHRWKERAEAHRVEEHRQRIENRQRQSEELFMDGLAYPTRRLLQLSELFFGVKGVVDALLQKDDVEANRRGLPALLAQLRGLMADIAREVTLAQGYLVNTQDGELSPPPFDVGKLKLLSDSVLGNANVMSEEDLQSLLDLLSKAGDGAKPGTSAPEELLGDGKDGPVEEVL
jgi:hypothetical protein